MVEQFEVQPLDDDDVVFQKPLQPTSSNATASRIIPCLMIFIDAS